MLKIEKILATRFGEFAAFHEVFVQIYYTTAQRIDSCFIYMHAGGRRWRVSLVVLLYKTN